MDLIKRALQALQRNTGVRADVEGYEIKDAYRKRADAQVRIRAQGKEVRFIVEVKKALTKANLGVVIHQMARYQEKALLVADYVNANLAQRLREMNIPFVDTAGNAFINKPPVFVYMTGQRPPEDTETRRPTRAFQATGLRVLFAFFCNPELINAPYRDIATAAGVALGTVGWVTRDLRELGYLIDLGKHGRRLLQKERLLRRWATEYPERLRPKLLLGRFRAPREGWWEDVRIREFQAYWGGEVAAARLTKYLKPEAVTIYARALDAKFQLMHKLRRDPTGRVEILKLFWNFGCHHGEADTVHPVLVYADLLATGDPRNIETARLVYDNELARLIRED